MLGRLSAGFACLFASLAIVTLLSLHWLRPELSPAAHMISEYGVGPHAWVMAVCFGSYAVASATLLIALAATARGALTWVGLFFLLIASAGLAIGGIYPADPTTNDPNLMSHSGRMHGVGFMIGVPGELLSVLLLSLALRKHSLWMKSPVLLAAAAVWVSLLVMVPLLMRQQWFGWPNRTFMLGFAAWILVCARPLLQSHAASIGYESARPMAS
jgi:hypothetical protein